MDVRAGKNTRTSRPSLSLSERSRVVTSKEEEAPKQPEDNSCMGVTVLLNSQCHVPSRSQGALIICTRKYFLKMG